MPLAEVGGTPVASSPDADTFGLSMRNLFIATILLSACTAWGQTGQPAADPHVFHPAAPMVKPAAIDTPTVPTAGNVTVHASDKISGLMSEYAGHKRTLKGYRVQIFIGDRNKAEDMRRSFLAKHPEVPAYLSYLAPNFRVRVGDLRDRVTAEKLRSDVSLEYPGLYVVPDDIELPRLAEGK